MTRPTTRCKPGDLAIFIGGLNLGKLVHIDRAFIGEEVIDGTIFTKSPNSHAAWVVTSLGGPLICHFYSSNAINPKTFTVAAFDENILRPLRKPRGADQTMSWSAKPTLLHQAQSMKARV